MFNNPQKPKIVFMGTSQFAATVLKALVSAQYDISAVYTKPDAKAGRKQELQKSAVKAAAEELNISVETPLKLDQETIEKIKNQKPDLIIVAAYGKILPPEILKIPRFGCLNVHASLLPKYRGSSPIQNALLDGEKETGVTIMLMDEGVDTGDIIIQRKTSIGKDEMLLELTERLSQLGAGLLIDTVPQWISGYVQAQPQDNSKAVICQLIEREDGKINWADNAEDIYNQYRALTPWPGIFSFWKQDESYMRLKLKKISYDPKDPSEPHHLGEVFLLDGNVAVKAESGSIMLLEVQLEGKKTVTAEEFLRGASNFIGSILK